ncbi:STAS domain-containing protein [Alkalihalophilus marmarensis]|uniref:STAS domain-containing protein n=1 Tax=Alkalihalophilus marmarensis TaxID=521377 RepID=UPI002E24953E|nr:STAS domain-containing protein [Alkalihalophilus marmarensis]
MTETNNLPLPYFKIDRSYDVLQQSNSAFNLFGTVMNLSAIVDQESLFKSKLLQVNALNIELVLKTSKNPLALFECSIEWFEDTGFLLCAPSNHMIPKLEQLVKEHQKRLASTNFELLEQKEELHALLTKILRLSAPILDIDDHRAVISFFGDLNAELIKVNTHSLLNRAYEKSYNELLIDFSGVGEITEEGMNQFVKLINQFKFMGMTIGISGIKPDQALDLKKNKIKEDIVFKNSLKHFLNVNKRTTS